MNNRIGFIETPKWITNLMVELISHSDKNQLKILDTGFGKGIFLESLVEHGFNNLYGIEIEESFYKYCKQKFLSYNFHNNLILGDYLTYDFSEKFDVIIGNPPYVHFNSLPQDMAKNIKNICGTGEADIYYAFIIKSINLLKENGELIYITPYHFFYNTYAKFIRNHILKNGKIELVIDLDEVHLFENESPETIIFKFIKGNFDFQNKKIKLINIKNRKRTIATDKEIYSKCIESIVNKQSNFLFEYYEINHFKTSDFWSTIFIEIPEFPKIKLKEIARVGVGLVSGFDKAYILNNNEVSLLNDKEKLLIKNFIKANNCEQYLTKSFAKYIVIDDSIKDEEYLKEVYPNIYNKIIPFKDKMSKRYLPNNKKWFNWQALRNYKFILENLNKKRIYVPTLDRHLYNRFCLAPDGLFPSGDVLFIQPFNEEDVYFLLGYLNSNFFRKYYLMHGARRGGRISFTQHILENIPIPIFPLETKRQIIDYVKNIIKQISNRNLIDKLNNLIENKIFEKNK